MTSAQSSKNRARLREPIPAPTNHAAMLLFLRLRRRPKGTSKEEVLQRETHLHRVYRELPAIHEEVLRRALRARHPIGHEWRKGFWRDRVFLAQANH